MTSSSDTPSPSRRPTSRDVAARAGVSQATVSYVLNNKSSVSAATREKVLKAMEELQYRSHAGARFLRTSHTHTIALLISADTEEHGNEAAPYIDAIVQAAQAHNYSILINTARQSVSAIEEIAGRSMCDGFIVMDITVDDRRIEVLRSLGIPAVLVGRPGVSHGLPVVDFDTRQAGRDAVEELVQTGHKHIVIVGESLLPSQNISGTTCASTSEVDKYFFVREFYAGVQEEAQKHQIDYALVPHITDDWESFRATQDQLLRDKDNALGFITRRPHITQWLMWLLQLNGLTPGKDVSVVSHCSNTWAQSFPTKISNVSSRPYTMGRQATELLIDLIGNQALYDTYLQDETDNTVLISSPGVVRRETTVNFL